MHVTKADKEKDLLIQQLHEAMEREQKIQDERVIMLQIQIERLIEMRSKSCGSSTLQTPRDIVITVLNEEDDKHQHALIEISALNELLSRILGERDVLSVKVRNLERLIKEMSTRKKIDHGYILYQLTCKKCEGGSVHTIGKTSQDLKSTVKKHYKEVYMMVERYKEDDEGEGNEDTNECSAGGERPTPLFYYRLGTSAPPLVRSFIDENCHCKHGDIKESNVKHEVHHDLGHRPELRNLPKNILSKVDQLTVVDAEIYTIALREFLAEIAWLESSSALGRRVLCSDKLKRLEPELSYIVLQKGEQKQNLNITQLYDESTITYNKAILQSVAPL